ncbi:DUF1178 family protein [Thalassococcus sp. S3]|uniref:DUF1178 family protein n=1 Tax=Thalassococcus sp. S3 TaxID=2017482 RepID=UPI00102409FE|nr:DUF1178 family protein [Thalassococcus sp. S3]QBF32922.1 hypothetical protein CFI11_17095 [Thalassococcus sp. S3]
MIQYALKCADGHTFDSWFQSAEAYDKLESAGMVTCAVCGSSQVEKAVMTPRVGSSRSEPSTALTGPASPAEQALADMRRHVEENADYVGTDFASEARAMHVGDAPERSIYGEARPEDAKQLIDDGVPVAPLPFLPPRKTN